MVRVGIPVGAGWFGGVNYFRNLLKAVVALPDLEIEPVLLVGQKAEDVVLKGFPSLETIRSPWFDQYTPKWALRQASQVLLPANPIFERFLSKNGIDVLSHGDFLGKRSSIPSLCWIPDFQHVNLPHLFSRSELMYRNLEFGRMARMSTRVILSSYAARDDLARFAPSGVERARVLQFVAQPQSAIESIPDLSDLQRTYDIPDNYFYLPNQFWVHKNHELVIDALSILKRKNSGVRVVSTGKTEDYRKPGHFKMLMEKAERLGVASAFEPLGIVPYRDLVGLMAHSMAVINPSKSEGWSTTVEEAKSLGKRVILSNLRVHKEQAPLGGVFVDPDSAEEMADAMQTVVEQFSIVTERDRMHKANANLPARVADFARTYQDIVLDTAGR